MPESEGNIIGIRATGRLTASDYQEVLIPNLEALIKKHGKIRFLAFLDEGFTGHEPGAFWEDMKFFPRHQDDFEKVVIVGAPKRVEVMLKLLAPIMDGETRTFFSEQLQEAWDWIKLYGGIQFTPVHTISCILFSLSF